MSTFSLHFTCINYTMIILLEQYHLPIITK